MYTYRWSLLLSLLLHATLLIIILQLKSLNTQPVARLAGTTSAPIQAIAIDESKVMATVAELTQQRTKEHQQQQQKLVRLQKQAARVKKERIAATQALKRIHKETLAQQQLLQQQQQKLKQTRQQVSQEAKKIASLKHTVVASVSKAAKPVTPKSSNTTVVSKATAAQASVVSHYKAMLVKAISQHWLMPAVVDTHVTCVLRARLAPDGSVLTVSVKKSSGNDALDRSAVAAVYKASPLPIPKDSSLFDTFRELQLTVRPEGVIGA